MRQRTDGFFLFDRSQARTRGNPDSSRRFFHIKLMEWNKVSSVTTSRKGYQQGRRGICHHNQRQLASGMLHPFAHQWTERSTPTVRQTRQSRAGGLAARRRKNITSATRSTLPPTHPPTALRAPISAIAPAPWRHIFPTQR